MRRVRRLLCWLNPWGHRWDAAPAEVVELRCSRCDEAYDRIKHCRPPSPRGPRRPDEWDLYRSPRARDAGAGGAR